jgi:hypothetical protein
MDSDNEDWCIGGVAVESDSPVGPVWNTSKNVVDLDLLTFLVGVLEVPVST